jgi:hypothetical protein
MTQTTNEMSGAAAQVEISTNGSVWTDISGHEQSVQLPPQTRASGVRYTHDGDTAVITFGKREPVEITVNILYTEEATDGFEVLRAQHETAGGGAVYLRWSPAGGSGGDFQYATGATKLSQFQYPPVDAEDAQPIAVSFAVMAASITKSTIAT